MTNKLKSKIKAVIGSGQEFNVLCEDGSVWRRFFHKNIAEYSWECVVEPYEEPVEEEPTKDEWVTNEHLPFEADKLPDQEPTTEEYLTVDKEPNKATESKKPLLSKEAQEALDELKHALGCWDYSGKWPTRDGEYGYVFDTARTLVNALESKDKKEWPKCKNPSGVFELCTFEDGKCTGCGELEGEG